MRATAECARRVAARAASGTARGADGALRRATSCSGQGQARRQQLHDGMLDAAIAAADEGSECEVIEPSVLAPKLAATLARPMVEIKAVFEQHGKVPKLWPEQLLSETLQRLNIEEDYDATRIPYAAWALRKYANEVHAARFAFNEARIAFEHELDEQLGSDNRELLSDIEPHIGNLACLFNEHTPAGRWLMSATTKLFASGIFDVSPTVAANNGTLQRIGAALDALRDESGSESDSSSDGEEADSEEESGSAAAAAAAARPEPVEAAAAAAAAA